MNDTIMPFVAIALGSIFLGTFGLGLKHLAPLRWEAWWLIYSIVGMLLFPWIWAALAVPHLLTIIARSADTGAVFWGALFGFLWGIGGITFGMSVESLGIALTYGIVMGLSTAVGSLIPLMRQGGFSSSAAAPLVVVAVVVLLGGVAVISFAGVRRERRAAAEAPANKKQLHRGLVIVIVSGVMSSLLAVGFDFAAPMTGTARSLGIETAQISLARWAVVCSGAFLMNAAYCLTLLVRNGSWATFAAPGSGKAYLWATATGAFWFTSFGISGYGMQMMGRLGVSIGWSMLLGLALITSTLWSVATGEWKNASGPFRIMLAGLVIVILAICILGYSRSLAS